MRSGVTLGWRGDLGPGGIERPITLEDLATHRSGLPRLPAGMLLRGMTLDRRDPYAGLDDDRMIEATRETSPRRPPGGKFAYSNYGAGLLGYALARAAGTSNAELLADRITAPLGLDDNAVVLPPDAEGRLTQGRSWMGRPAERWDLTGLVGAGGLVSTAPDLLALLAPHSPGADGDLGHAPRRGTGESALCATGAHARRGHGYRSDAAVAPGRAPQSSSSAAVPAASPGWGSGFFGSPCDHAAAGDLARAAWRQRARP